MVDNTHVLKKMFFSMRTFFSKHFLMHYTSKTTFLCGFMK